MRRLVVLWAVALLGCTAGPTTLRIDVSVKSGQPAPNALRASVFDVTHALVLDRTIEAQLPGMLIVQLADVSQTVRVVVASDDPVAALGAISIQARPHRQVRGAIVLDAATLDSDGDHLPDAVDNCPLLANPMQADADGNGMGDGCDTTPADLTTPLPPDFAGADLYGVDLAGVDFATPPPPDLAPDMVTVPSAVGPRLFFSDITSGPNSGGEMDLGAFITLFGEGFGATRGTSKVTIGGKEVARYVVWGENNALARGLDMIVVQPGSGVTLDAITAQDIVVTIGGTASNPLPFLVRPGTIYFVERDHPSACTVSPGAGDCLPPPATSAATCPSDTGTLSKPFGHIYQARCRMVPGDIVYIKKTANDYTELDPTGNSGSLTIATDFPHGTVDKPIAYVGYPVADMSEAAASPVFAPPPGTDWGFVTFLDDRAYYTFAKLTIKNAVHPFPIANTGRRIIANQIENAGTDYWGAISVNNYAAKVRLLGNYLKNNGGGSIYPGISIYGDGSVRTIDDIEIGWNQVDDQTGGASIAIVGASATPGNLTNIAVHDNLLLNNHTTDHILVGGTGSATASVDNVTVYNNIAVGAVGAGVRLNNQTMHITIAHNTLVANTEAGIAFETLGAGRVTFVDNIVVGASGGGIYYTGTTTGVFASVGPDLWYSGPAPGCPSFESSCLYGAPMFMSTATNDYRVVTGSPAIGAATATTFSRDYFGVPRPQGTGAELGACELVP